MASEKFCPLIHGATEAYRDDENHQWIHAVILQTMQRCKTRQRCKQFSKFTSPHSKTSARPKRNQNLKVSHPITYIPPHGLSIIRRIGCATGTFGAEDVGRSSAHYKACNTESTSHLTSYTFTVTSKHVYLPKHKT